MSVAFVAGSPVSHGGHACVIMCNYGFYTNECMENQVCKWFAHTDRTVTQDMSAISQEKNILSNYWVSNKVK